MCMSSMTWAESKAANCILNRFASRNNWTVRTLRHQVVNHEAIFVWTSSGGNWSG